MLKPRFLSTRTLPLVILRRTQGSYVGGRWVEGTIQNITRKVNIQPIKPEELMMMQEADRTKEWYQLYSAEDLRTQVEGSWDADEFDWNGSRFKIMKVQRYQMGVLDHWSVLAARIGPSP